MTLDTAGGQYPNGIYMARLTRSTWADGRVETFGYNVAGELEWKQRSDGTFITLTRDKQHRVKTVTYPTTGGGGSFTVETLYDEFGRAKSTTDNTGTTIFKWDALSRPLQTIPPAPQKTLDYSYQDDSLNNRWSTTINVAGVGWTAYREDSKGRLFQVENNAALQAYTQEYWPDGMLWKKGSPNNVVEERLYDNRARLTRVLIWKPGGSDPNNPGHLHNRFDYGYRSNPADPLTDDGTGHLLREVDIAGQVHAFRYSDFYELVGETDPALGAGEVTFQYDANGNRTRRTQGSVTDYYGVDAANRLHWVNRGLNAPPDPINRSEPYTILTYNNNGATSRRERRAVAGGTTQTLWLWWDGADKLRKATDINDPADPTPFFTATYNGDGIRTKKQDMRGGVLQAHDTTWGPTGLLHGRTLPPSALRPLCGLSVASAPLR